MILPLLTNSLALRFNWFFASNSPPVLFTFRVLSAVPTDSIFKLLIEPDWLLSMLRMFNAALSVARITPDWLSSSAALISIFLPSSPAITVASLVWALITLLAVMLSVSPATMWLPVPLLLMLSALSVTFCCAWICPAKLSIPPPAACCCKVKSAWLLICPLLLFKFCAVMLAEPTAAI